jgi:hypothetical protein
MAAVLVAIAIMTVVGLPLTIALDRSARGPLLVGLAFLYGSAATFFAMLLLSVLHIGWTSTTTTAALMIIAIAAAVVAKRSTQHSALSTQHCRPHPLDLVTLLIAAGYTAYATIASLWEWDFWAIWGLKARVFLEHGGIDWRFLGSRWNDFAHPDYPLLVPLNFDYAALLNGGWSDRWLGLFNVAYALALLLVVRALVREEASNLVSALATLAVAAVGMSRYIGMAEGAIIAYGGAALLLIRRRSWLHGALLLGLAANCKNEGVALVVAAAVGVALVNRRNVLKLVPAVVLMLPWLLLRLTHVLPTDIAQGSVLSRFADRAAHAGALFALLGRTLVDPWSWLVILLTFLIVPRAWRQERFLLIVTAVQLAFYVATYFVTPHDLRWHVMTSWSRLTRQVQLPITVACVLVLAQFLFRGEDAAHAEARPVQ